MAKRLPVRPVKTETVRTQEPSKSPVDLQDLGLAMLLFCGTLLSYLPSLRGGLIMDDARHLTRPDLQPLHGLARIWFELGATSQYYPLLHSAFWFEHWMWGDAVLGYHLTNLLLHTLSALLVVLIVRRLSIPGAWLAGFIFALHPVCVNSVAWIAEQKSTLSMFFYLSAALAYLYFDQTRRRSHYFLALGLFVLALLSKTVTATLPAALLLVFWWQRGRLNWKRDVQPLLPWFAIGAAAGLFTAFVERKYIGAEGPEFAMPLVERFLVAGRVIWFYLGKLVWPRNIMFIYPRWTVDSAAWWQYLFPLGALALAAGLWLIARRTRGPLAGFLFFVGTLFPVLGFLNVYPFLYSYVFDHFQYIASLGIIVPLASGLTLAASRIPVVDRRLPVMMAGVLVMALGGLTWRVSSVYREAETLYADTLIRNPTCWVAHNNLGVECLSSPGRLPEAIQHFETALRLKPDAADVHHNLGSALTKVPGRQPDAIAEFEKALRIKPRFPEAHNNLGRELAKLPGRSAEAISHFHAALALNPNFADAQVNLGVALSGAPGELPAAISHLETAVQIDPQSAEAHNNLGSALMKIDGRTQEAIREFDTALRINPNFADAHNNLGGTLAHTPDRVPEAITHLRAALRIQPDFADAHMNLGNVFSQMPGHFTEAIPEYEAVLRIAPDYPEAHNNLGIALSEVPGRSNEAIRQFEAALKQDSNSADAHMNLGSLLANDGRTAEAIRHFETALRIRPDFAEGHYYLGVALSKIPGRMPDAMAHFETSLRLKPNPELKQMVDRLRH